MTETSNYALKQYEGSDYVNVLTVNNPNNVIIDAALKENKDAAVQTANHLKSGNVHAITRLAPDSAMLRFTATANFTTGDTFTVDGTQVTALLPNGATLSTGAFKINSTVLCCLVGTLLTVFTVGQAENIDADTLGGHEPDYFATADALGGVQQTATSAGIVANAASETATQALELVVSKKYERVWGNGNPTATFNAQPLFLDLSAYDAVVITYRANANIFTEAFHLIQPETASLVMRDGFANYGSTSFCREISSITASGINFGNAYGSNSAANNALMIPVYVYGIKF